jgi:hypothetical protein
MLSELLQERDAVAKAPVYRKAPWIKLRDTYIFNRFHFLVEVRAVAGRPAMPRGELEVRIRGPLCMRCGAPMTRVESAPGYERYACRRGAGHCEYWVGRVNHQGFAEFVAEHLRSAVYRALLEGRLALSSRASAPARTEPLV